MDSGSRAGGRTAERAVQRRFYEWCLLVAVSLSVVTAVAQQQIASALPSADSPVVSGTGEWPLDELGHGDTPIDPAIERAGVTFRYDASPGARQGPDTWWHLRLHFRIQFARRIERPVYVSASTQGHTAAQVKFEPDPDDPSRVKWSSVTLTGRTDEVAPWDHEIEVDTSNYLQYGGVSAGSNALEVVLEQPEAAIVRRLVVNRSTAIIVDRDSPHDLALEVHLSNDRIHEGERFVVPFGVVNSDPAPAQNVVVRVQLPRSDGIRVLQPTGSPAGEGRVATMPLGTVTHAVDGSIVFRAERAGEYDIVVTAAGSASNDRDAVRVRAVVYGRSSVPKWLLFLLVVGLVGGGGALYRHGSRSA